MTPSPPPRPPRPRRAPKLFKHRDHWYALFYDGRRQPKRKWIALATTSLRQARRVFVPMEEAWLTTDWDPWRDPWGASVSVAKAVRLFLAANPTGDIPERSRKNREIFYERFAASLPPGLLVEHVRPADVEAFVNEPTSGTARLRKKASGEARGATERTASTRRSYVDRLGLLFAWCAEQRLCPANPMAAVERPRATRRARPEHLSVAQFRALLARIEASDQAWMAPAVELAVYTGLRLGELVRLRWRDVDLAARSLRVEDTAAGRVKTDASVGAVPLVAPAWELLGRLRASRPTGTGDRPEEPNAPVLVSPAALPGEARPMNAQVLSRLYKAHARAIGAGDTHFHSLRKTTSTWLANEHVPLEVRQRILRHANVATTAGHYTDVWPETVRAELDRAFGSLLAPVAAGPPAEA